MPYVSVDEALNATIVDPAREPPEPGLEARRSPLVASDSVRIVRLRVEAGQEPHLPHRHPHADEVMYVLDGLGQFTVGDDPPFVAGARSLVFVPRGVTHRIQVPGPGPLIWLSIVAPNQDLPDEALEDAADIPADRPDGPSGGQEYR